MKKSVIVLMSLLCSAGCVQQEFGKSQKVANLVNGLTVCDRSLLKDTIVFPLSYFTEEMEIVKLEMSNDAVVGVGDVVIGEKYILVRGTRNNPSKLFAKDGKFITCIGAIGRGPGEYQNIYDEVLDEKNDRIYFLPWMSQNILVYDLKGNVLDPVKLPMSVPKGKFFVDTSTKTVSVFALPFTGSQYVAWTQTMSGEVINGIDPGHLSVRPDFSNEIVSAKNTSDMVAFEFTFDSRPDTLYHFDSKANKLVPRFVVDYGDNASFQYPVYTELPNHYMGYFSAKELKQVGPGSFTTTNHVFFVVEKSTLKGDFFKLINDFLGDMMIEWPIYAFSNGYFIKNYDPGDLLDDLEKALLNEKLSNDMRQKMAKLKNSISEKDNNYILYAKLKK
jgi:hypothetical protein